MTRDTVFRIASIGKPILAATALVHVERGTVGLDDPVSRWLPELAEPRVLRDPSGPLDDTVPAVRPITVGHLLCGLTDHYLFENAAALTPWLEGNEPLPL